MQTIRGRGPARHPSEASPRETYASWANSKLGLSEISQLVRRAATRFSSASRGPLPEGQTGDVLASAREDLGSAELPHIGLGSVAAFERVLGVLSRYGIQLTHRNAVAHLQPPTLAISVAADAMASASNASLDTFDSGPASIAIERWVINTLATLAGLGADTDGVMTPGGSISNLLGLLLARDAAAAARGHNASRSGVFALTRPVVLCSELSHFSVHRACAALGLGEDAVRPVPVDATRRMRPECLHEILRTLRDGETPIAIVATAGTTDFGSVDPLPQIATIARNNSVWLHIDAAYGFGALFSDRLAPMLNGIALGDSITLDLHKLGWQPAAASVLLVSDVAAFGPLRRNVAYLNPGDDAEAGYDGLLGRSLQTTRRADAVKIVTTFLALGRQGLGRMVDACHDLALYAATRIECERDLALVAPVELSTVLFRYRPADWLAEVDADAAHDLQDELNARIRRRLLESGEALIGRTSIQIDSSGQKVVCLKFTLMNPEAKPADIDALIDSVIRAGKECEAQLAPRRGSSDHGVGASYERTGTSDGRRAS